MRLLRCISTINEGSSSDLFSVGLKSHIRSLFWTLTQPQYWRWKVPVCFMIALVLLWDGWMDGQTDRWIWAWERPDSSVSVGILHFALPKHSTDYLSLIYSRTY